MPEKTCNLCGCTHSEDVGSHIITEALTRSCFNQPGKSGRGDFEEIYRITPYGKDTPYVGRAIDGDRFRTITGMDFSDEILAQNVEKQRDYINKDLVCRACEKRFGPVEQYFMEKIFNPMDIAKATRISNEYPFGLEEYKIAHLFFLINIWRMSISRFQAWKLEEEHESRIGAFLNEVLGHDSVDKILERYESNKSQVGAYQFVALFIPRIYKDGSESGVLIENTTEPYFILLNQVALLFSVNRFDIASPPSIMEDTLSRGDMLRLIQSQTSGLIFRIIEGLERERFFLNYFLIIFDSAASKHVTDFSNTMSDLSVYLSSSEREDYKKIVIHCLIYGHVNGLSEVELAKTIAKWSAQFCVEKGWVKVREE